MILRFYPTKDNTIYESAPSVNAGLDAILEITKTSAESGNGQVTSSFNSRILMDFNLQQVSESLAALGVGVAQAQYGLKLFTTEAEEIPLDYTLEAYLISGSWNMGTGRQGNVPATTQGSSWYYRVGKTSPLNIWETSSFQAGYTASWQVNPGGGVWALTPAASQSFSYTTTDVDMDVTALIHQAMASNSFDGLIIKKEESAEQSPETIKALRFYSKETQTIYSPILEVRYDDSVITGSLASVDTEEDFNIVATNLKQVYKEGSRPRLNFAPRYRYPASVFQTSSLYVDSYKLPNNTQYAIYYAQTDDAVIDFSAFTKVSSDNRSSYVRLHLDSLQPERYYRILIKVPDSDGHSYQIYDNKWIFKVERN
jgi:hypothetical protein